MPIVNYVVEHTRFIQYAIDEMLSSSERLLWYGLMDIMNSRAQGNIWPDEFIRIDNARLCLTSGIKYDAMVEARNKLKQRGLIDYMPGERNKKNPTYKMFYFFPQYAKPETEEDGENPLPGGMRKWQRDSQWITGYPEKPDKNPCKNEGYPEKPEYFPGNNPCYNPCKTPGKTPCKTPSIYTKHKEKLYTQKPYHDEDEEEEEEEQPRAREDADGEELIPNQKGRMTMLKNAYLFNFGKRGSPREIFRILQFCHRTGMPDQMAAKAMEIAAGNGPDNPVGYTLTILEDWKQHHVYQVHQIEPYQTERDMQEKRGWFADGVDAMDAYGKSAIASAKRLQENIDAGLEE